MSVLVMDGQACHGPGVWARPADPSILAWLGDQLLEAHPSTGVDSHRPDRPAPVGAVLALLDLVRRLTGWPLLWSP